MNRIFLLFIIILSIIAKNKSMVYAGIVVFILSFITNENAVKFVKNNFLNIGLVFLMIWMLIPLTENQNEISILNPKEFLSLDGIVSFLSGLFVVIVASKGLKYLNRNTTALSGAILGSIVGVTFFGGTPVGMLTGSGIAYLILKLIKGL
ncbi:DUF441 family protein [Sporanaerobacter acetigenes]|uniref:Uncharacterized membrane protein, DUF441 family n=1 Tax=Sporanaerobacter acetigenes DSM 13106 TaxID=1123281 RepID=A0A1M5WBP4_9FIRM|nr:DUF441 family protein [Sporanaerobacter acetigenes]SHH85019.1 Uncharacterized membrane protein, DUF441 family [Sporanaerobacter acetigenes DSM 13106]